MQSTRVRARNHTRAQTLGAAASVVGDAADAYAFRASHCGVEKLILLRAKWS